MIYRTLAQRDELGAGVSLDPAARRLLEARLRTVERRVRVAFVVLALFTILAFATLFGAPFELVVRLLLAAAFLAWLLFVLRDVR